MVSYSFESLSTVSPTNAHLFFVAHEGDAVEVLRLLREYPATVNMMYSRDFGIMVVRGYALDIAAAEGHLECVKVLMDFGANQLQPEPDFGQLAIHRAASNGHLDIVKYLLEKGAPILEPDQQGQTSLHFAAEHGRTEVCKFLLDHGARPSLAVKYRGKTPKMWAEMGGHFDCAAVL